MSDFWHAYLFAFDFWIGVPLGCLALLLFNHVAGGAWGHLARRQLEAAALTLPLMALAFVPLCFNLPVLFPWARAGLEAIAPIAHQRAYLDAPFFYGRAALYFLVWCGAAIGLARSSSQQDRNVDRDLALADRTTRAAYGFLPLVVLATSFASTDWLMSLEPGFSSSVFELRFFAGTLLSGATFMTLSTAWLVRRPEHLARLPGGQAFADQYQASHLQDMATVTFGLMLLFAYLAYVEYLIVYAEDLPKETSWYVLRSGHGWQWIALSSFLSQLVVPFFALLNRQLKRMPAPLAGVCALLVGGHALWMFWMVLPEAHPILTVTVWDVVLPLAMGIAWLALYRAILIRRPLLARHHPPLREVFAIE